MPFRSGSRPWLEAVAIGMILVQGGDTLVGVIIRDRVKTFGPAGTAVLNAASARMPWPKRSSSVGIDLIRATVAAPLAI